MKQGRPTKYDPSFVEIAQAYVDSCETAYEDYVKSSSEKGESYQRVVKANVPTMPGLACELKVNKTTLYEWGKRYEEFSNVLDNLVEKQERMLLQGGLSGDYNPVIVKLILSARHDYKEKTDVTSDGKALPTPIINVQRNDQSRED